MSSCRNGGWNGNARSGRARSKRSDASVISDTESQRVGDQEWNRAERVAAAGLQISETSARSAGLAAYLSTLSSPPPPDLLVMLELRPSPNVTRQQVSRSVIKPAPQLDRALPATLGTTHALRAKQVAWTRRSSSLRGTLHKAEGSLGCAHKLHCGEGA